MILYSYWMAWGVGKDQFNVLGLLNLLCLTIANMQVSLVEPSRNLIWLQCVQNVRSQWQKRKILFEPSHKLNLINPSMHVIDILMHGWYKQGTTRPETAMPPKVEFADTSFLRSVWVVFTCLDFAALAINDCGDWRNLSNAKSTCPLQ